MQGQEVIRRLAGEFWRADRKGREEKGLLPPPSFFCDEEGGEECSFRNRDGKEEGTEGLLRCSKRRREGAGKICE